MEFFIKNSQTNFETIPKHTHITSYALDGPVWVTLGPWWPRPQNGQDHLHFFQNFRFVPEVSWGVEGIITFNSCKISHFFSENLGTMTCSYIWMLFSTILEAEASVDIYT